MGCLFEVLGPVRLRRGDRAVPAAGRMQSVLLGVLLSRANSVVPVDVLVDALWGEPEPRAVQRLHLHVYRLRRVLDDPDRLTSSADGYCLRVAPDELDATLFTTLVRAEEPDSAVRTATLTRALDLWRGTPYAGLDVPVLADEAARLTELRLSAMEERFDAELAMDRAAAVVAGLADLVRAHPLRERAHLLHITALYRAGRRADALAAFRAARRVFVTELGIEPGFELRALEASILAGEPTAATAPGPAQLPRDVPAFVGRTDVMSRLDDIWTTRAGPAVVAGTAGVGKTALAIRWAHRNRDAFPDGHLYVDLHGFGPGRPVAPEDVLAGFLRALGVDGAAVPADPVERAARFRSLVHDRRLLVVLDNAQSAAQVRPLLAGGPSCFIVVTSRDSLAGLVARDGAVRVDVERLAPADARRLVRDLIGPRAHAEPAAVAELVERCARLPLALRIAAEAIGARAGLRIADVVTELDLDALDDTGDSTTDIRAVFSWSYRHLDDDAARLFRLMGRHPWEAQPAALAALAGLDRATTERALTSLARSHLVEEARCGRIGMHDLLRAYAAELPEPDTDAVRRLLAWYVRAAAAARQALIPQSPPLPMTGVEPFDVTFADSAAALAWFETERPVLVGLVTAAAEDDLVWRLAGALLTFFNIGKHWDDWVACDRVAVECARRAGDAFGEATILNGLGVAYDDLGDHDGAVGCHTRAATLFAAVGETHLGAWNLNNLGVVYDKLGRFDDAVATHRAALELFRSVGDRRGVGFSLNNLGDVHRQRGEYLAAEVDLMRALELQRADDDTDALRYTYAHLAELHRAAGRPAAARAWYEQGVETGIACGDRWHAASLLTRLADLAESPAGLLREAHALFVEVGDLESAAEVQGQLTH